MNNKLQNFLAKISQIESAGGKYTNHPMIKSGIQAGSSAYGQYGLMPNTIRELASRQNMNDFNSLSDQEIKDKFKQNPELENKFAEFLANKVLNQYGGNEQKAAYAWNMGHNLPESRIGEEQLTSSPYVQKFQKLSDMSQPQEKDMAYPVEQPKEQMIAAPPMKFNEQPIEDTLPDITKSKNFQKLRMLLG